MNASVLDRPKSIEVAQFLDLVAARPELVQELKAAPDDEEFVQLVVLAAGANGIRLTAQQVVDQMIEDRRLS